jgi:glycosyltransferase involved in cell wall biosynthesis
MIITIPSFGLGKTGGDRVLTVLANNLIVRGHKVNVVNLGKKPVPFVLSKKVNLISVPFGANRRNPVDFIFKGINKLANNLPASDIYLANWVYTILPCIANNDKGKTVFLAQANEAKEFKKPSLKILNAISYEAHRLNVPIITPSSYLQKKIKTRFDNNARIIPPFVNSNLFKPKKEKKKHEKLRLLFVSSNVKNKNKGFDILLKACLNLKNIPFELHVATQSDIDLKKNKNITIHKPRDDKELSAIYGDCDVFFHLSKEEGFGLTLLEAMASGLICVASDSGGINDFAIDNRNCLMVKRNSRAISRVIEEISKDVNYYQSKLVPNAIKTAGFYTEKRMVDGFEKLFLRLL